jgi:hypothetical protein
VAGFQGIGSSGVAWRRILAAALSGVLVSSCGRASDLAEAQLVELQLFVPGVGEFTQRYSCPDVADPNGAFGTGPRPAFRTIRFSKGSTTLLVSTQGIPDRFCTQGKYEGPDVSGPFNVWQISANDGVEWFRDDGDAMPSAPGGRPLSVNVSGARLDVAGDADPASLMPGDVDLTYRSGLFLPVAFRPVDAPSSTAVMPAEALQELRLRLGARDGFNALSSEVVCSEFGKGLAERVGRLPRGDARKDLLARLVEACTSSVPGREELAVEIGGPRAFSLGGTQMWAIETPFARGEGMLLGCSIGEVPCVGDELPDPDTSLRGVGLIGPQSREVKFTPDGTTALSTFYLRKADTRDQLILVSNTLHTFDLRGLQ